MKKIYITLFLILVLAFALVVVSSATSVMYNSSDSAFNDMIEESSNPTYADLMTGQFNGSYINYGNVTNGNFTIFVMTLASYENSYETYVYWVSDVEAFQIRYNGYTYNSFLTELDNNGYYDLSYRFNESGFTYLLNYQLVDTSTMVEWSTVDTVVKDWYINDYNAPVYENIDISSESSLNAFLNDNVNVATEYSKQYAYSEGYGVGYDTAENEASTTINELNNTINNLEISLDEALENGYAQGMADANAVERGIMSIVGAPMYILTSVFDVEIFGINLLNLITTIMTIIIVAWVVKKLAN